MSATPIALVYHGPINPDGARATENLVTAAMSDGAEHIELRICSSGGDVNAGMGLFNFLSALPIRIDTHNFGFCGSIAATIFLAGKRRTTCRYSNFTLHAATYSNGPRQGQVSDDNELISRPFRIDLAWSDERIASMFGTNEESTILPDTAVSMAIAHAVEDLPFQPGQRIVNVRLTG